MQFSEILGTKPKQQNDENVNEIALIFRRPPVLSTERNPEKFYK